MKTTTALSTLALLASSLSFTTAAPAPASEASKTKYFHLQPRTKSPKGQPNFNNLYLQSFHVGAGESTIVTTQPQEPSKGATFYIDQGSLIQNSSYPFVVSTINQAPYMSDAPQGYNYVALNIGDGSAGTKPFTYDQKTGEVKLNQPDFTFAVCRVNGTSPYFGVGPQNQLLWRKVSASKEDQRKPAKCADVTLHAVSL